MTWRGVVRILVVALAALSFLAVWPAALASMLSGMPAANPITFGLAALGVSLIGFDAFVLRRWARG